MKFGGVFRCTQNLNKKYGTDRVFNTPLCEQGIVAFGIGLACENNYSIAEIQFTDYILPAFDQIVNEASKLRYRSGGDWDCGKLTIRAPCAAVGHGGNYHSQSNEAFFAHSPGLVLVSPRSCIQAKGLLLASIKDPNPVIFFEPKSLYRKLEEDVPEDYYELELRKCEVVKQGTDLTIVTYGAQFHIIEEAVKEYEDKNDCNIEIVDLQTVYPIDFETIFESVRKTGRCIISHEGPLGNGIGSEVASQVQENCFFSLEAPVKRVCGLDTPFPLTLEPFYLPNKFKILQAIKETLTI